mmetsp:Transcript_52154/g.62829  ORF Transcript_52154/g.62829 Transcript_52154/m.62829 type:complete len:2141 (-) Transcript_52154:63-6485(-)
MGRYNPPLHKLCDSAHRKSQQQPLASTPNSKKSQNEDVALAWEKVRSYIQNGGDGENIHDELLQMDGPNKDDTPLRICVVGRAPSPLVVLLVDLAPRSTQMVDGKLRLPLHLACKRASVNELPLNASSGRKFFPNNVGSGDDDGSVVTTATPSPKNRRMASDSINVVRFLVDAFPRGTVCQDSEGRTPLHYLCLYHLFTRTPGTLESVVKVKLGGIDMPRIPPPGPPHLLQNSNDNNSASVGDTNSDVVSTTSSAIRLARAYEQLPEQQGSKGKISVAKVAVAVASKKSIKKIKAELKGGSKKKSNNKKKVTSFGAYFDQDDFVDEAESSSEDEKGKSRVNALDEFDKDFVGTGQKSPATSSMFSSWGRAAPSSVESNRDVQKSPHGPVKLAGPSMPLSPGDTSTVFSFGASSGVLAQSFDNGIFDGANGYRGGSGIVPPHPDNATSVPDDRQCLPLHYAVNFDYNVDCQQSNSNTSTVANATPNDDALLHSTRDVVRYLVKHHPNSVIWGDVNNRTPLLYYLINEALYVKLIPRDNSVKSPKKKKKSSNVGKDLILSKASSSVGEQQRDGMVKTTIPIPAFLKQEKKDEEDDHHPTFDVTTKMLEALLCDDSYDVNSIKEQQNQQLKSNIKKKSSSLISVLLNTNHSSASMAVCNIPDYHYGRPPLHWTCLLSVSMPKFVSNKCVVVLLEHDTSLLRIGDNQGMTPLHVFFYAGFQVNAARDARSKNLLLNLVEEEEDGGDAVNGSNKKSKKKKSKKKKKRHTSPSKRISRKEMGLSNSASEGDNDRYDSYSPRGNNNNIKRFSQNKKWQQPLPLEIFHTLLDYDKYNSVNYDEVNASMDDDNMGIEQQPPKKEEEVDEESALFMEDIHGWLPIHYACLSCAPVDFLRDLVESHPTSLITTDHVSQRAPLHVAFMSEVTTPHWTVEQIKILLNQTDDDNQYSDSDSDYSNHNQNNAAGLIQAGKIVTKMDDVTGRYPLHLAAENGASVEVLKLVLDCHVEAATKRNEDGNYPLHLCAKYHHESKISLVDDDDDSDDEEEEKEESKDANVNIMKDKVELLLQPVLDVSSKALFQTPGSYLEELPLHIACTHNISRSIISTLLGIYPQAISIRNANNLLPIDLHEEWKELHPWQLLDDEELEKDWMQTKLLLFAHHPELPYRQDESFLNEICNSIREDANRVSGKQTKQKSGQQLSDMPRRLWIFFCTYTYNDHSNKESNTTDYNAKPDNDHYMRCVEQVLHEIDYQSLQLLANTAVPHCNQAPVIECARRECAEAIHRAYLFLGRYKLNENVPIWNKSQTGKSLILKVEGYCDGSSNTKKKEETEKNLGGDAFTSHFYPACLKLFQRKQDFNREINTRRQLDISQVALDNNTDNEESDDADKYFLPLIDYFSSVGTANNDVRYNHDINEVRFNDNLSRMPNAAVNINGGGFSGDPELSTYPFAIVTPLCDRSLWDAFCHERMDMVQVKKCALMVGNALKRLHEQNICHGDVRMRNILRMNDKKWVLSDLSSCQLTSSETSAPNHMAENATFCSSVLPPELFARLDSLDVKDYEQYWSMGEFEIDEERDYSSMSFTRRVTRDKLKPRICADGSVHVVKSVRSVNSDGDDGLGGSSNGCNNALLPYEPVPVSESIDMWSFACMLFALCSGRTLFPTDCQNDELLYASSYSSLANWDKKAAEAIVYEHVTDPLAQDLLLHMLVSVEDRGMLSMGAIMSHPFFKPGREVSKVGRRIMDIRDTESKIHAMNIARERQEFELREWLKHRTTKVGRLSIEVQVRLDHASSELCRSICQSEHPPSLPFCFIMLPYKLVLNKSGKLTPKSKKGVELAERVGKQLLLLSKTITFAQYTERALKHKPDEMRRLFKEWSGSTMTHHDSIARNFLHLMGFKTKEDYMPNAKSMVSTKDVSLFMMNPAKEIKRLVHDSYQELLDLYMESKHSYLYLVDEYTGVPVAAAKASGPAPGSDAIYPYEIDKKIVPRRLNQLFPFMYIMLMYSRGVARGVAGQVKLTFEAAYPHIPGSWEVAAKGLKHELNKSEMVQEVKMLVSGMTVASTEVNGNGKSNDNSTNTHVPPLVSEWSSIYDFLLHIDVARSFSELRRIDDGCGSLWTTKTSIDAIQSEEAKQRDKMTAMVSMLKGGREQK